MFGGITKRIIAAPRRVLVGAFILLVLCGVYGAGAASHLLSGGYEDPNAESTLAVKRLDSEFGQGGLQIFVKLDAPPGTDVRTDQRVAAVGRGVVDELSRLDYVRHPILSVWTDPSSAQTLVSRDKTSTMIVATLEGGDSQAPARAKAVDEMFTGQRDGIELRVGGQAMVYLQSNQQTSRDLAIAEGIAIPISFVVLVVIFGGLVAAALPVLIGVISIIGTFALLRLIAEFTDVSIFALNLTTALGLALAIDYTLLLVTRYREELAAGRAVDEAVVATMSSAGRTVAFSAVTVGLSLAALAVFPMYFLRSFAYAGVGVVAVAAIAALIVTPALLTLLGTRIDALDVRRPIRRRLGLSEPRVPEPEQTLWYRLAQWVFRHAVAVGVGLVALLLVLGAPFLSIKFGFPDDRVLPASASAHQLQQEVREQYEHNAAASITAIVDGADDAPALARYTAELSKVDGITGVRSTLRGNAAIVNIATDTEPMTDAGGDQLRALRAVPVPAGMSAAFAGLSASNVDTVASIYAHLPWVLAIIAIATFILLFLFTGSVVMPLKALVLNVISLSATFGAMVWFFQEGHLGGLGTTATGFLVATMPVLMFCIAFGLSMDYEVFLLGRIREEWLASNQTRADNERAVAVGLARTGRVITAAALLMSIVFAGIAASQVSFMRMFGVGLALAVVMDATVIRMLLVPAFMKVAGRANWWAPRPLRALHDRVGMSEGPSVPDVSSSSSAHASSDAGVQRDNPDQTGEVTARIR